MQSDRESDLKAQIPTLGGVVTIHYPRTLSIIDACKVARVLVRLVLRPERKIP